MKQACKGIGGANRRGRAKRRGRNVTAEMESAEWWTPVLEVAMRERNSTEGVLDGFAVEAGCQTEDFEGGTKRAGG